MDEQSLRIGLTAALAVVLVPYFSRFEKWLHGKMCSGAKRLGHKTGVALHTFNGLFRRQSGSRKQKAPASQP
jgi:hypothetical protein